MYRLIITALSSALTWLFCILWSTQALSAEWRADVELGECYSHAYADGQWYQSLQSHSLDLESLCGRLGVSRLWGEARQHWWIGVNASLIDLGQPSITSKWGTDAQLLQSVKPTWSGYGYGESRGLSAGPIAEYRIGDWALTGETGLYAYRSVWHETAITMVNQGAQNFDYLKTGITWYGGAGVRWKWFTLRERYYRDPNVVAGLGKGVLQTTVGLSVPFK